MQVLFRLKPALAGILVAFLVMPVLAASADSGTGAFEGYTMTKLDSMDSIHLSIAGNVNATKPFIDTIDWYGKNDTESFFIFRYCPDPQNCVIGSATPDGKAIFAGDDRGAVPIGPAVTSDGQSIIFAIDQDASGEGIDGPGIYRMTLAHAIPEFPFAGIVAVASIASVIAITTIRMRR